MWRKYTYDFMGLHKEAEWFWTPIHFHSSPEKFNVVRLLPVLLLLERATKKTEIKKGENFPILWLFSFSSTPRRLSFNSLEYSEKKIITIFHLLVFIPLIFRRWLWNDSLLIFFRLPSLTLDMALFAARFFFYDSTFIWFLITTNTRGQARAFKESDKHVFANFICHGYTQQFFAIFMFIVFSLKIIFLVRESERRRESANDSTGSRDCIHI